MNKKTFIFLLIFPLIILFTFSQSSDSSPQKPIYKPTLPKPAVIEVPNVIGMSFAEAKKLLEVKGFKTSVKDLTQIDLKYKGKEAKVISQTPTAGTMLSFGSLVEILWYNPTSVKLPKPIPTPGIKDMPEITLSPFISSFSPEAARRFQIITIYGGNFYPQRGETTVHFYRSSFWIKALTITDTKITVKVPKDALSGPVTGCTRVDNTYLDFTSRIPLRVLLPPRIDSFSPHHGRVGTIVGILGHHLGIGGINANQVKFGELPANIISHGVLPGPLIDPTSYPYEPEGPPQTPKTYLTVSVPEGATTSPISVTTPEGKAVSLRSFEVIQ